MKENNVVCLPDCFLCVLVAYSMHYKMLYTYLLGTSRFKGIEPDKESGVGKYIIIVQWTSERCLEKYEEEIWGAKNGVTF